MNWWDRLAMLCLVLANLLAFKAICDLTRALRAHLRSHLPLHTHHDRKGIDRRV